MFPKRLILTFTAHVEGVQSCDLSCDSQLVVSGDIGSAVKVRKIMINKKINSLCDQLKII